MTLFITSFVAGFLTILAPCILPLLPVTLGGSVTEVGNKRRPLVIIGSLAISVFAFTLLLKGSTAIISISPTIWSYVSATILAVFGLSLLFPITWAKVMLKIPGHNRAESLMALGYKNRTHIWGDILIGAALGPVFTTCSPTFFVIIATVLPQSLGMGIVDLLAYILGLSISLLLVAYVGQKFVIRLEWATNPTGIFRKVLGVLFIIIALAIATGFDKKAETAILDAGFFDVTKLEQSLRETLEGSSKSPATTTALLRNNDSRVLSSTTGLTDNQKRVIENYEDQVNIVGETDGGRYIDIVKPAGFINSDPFKIADLIGKKVIIVDFIDYSCINCQRTFPYMVEWYKHYKDQGLEIVAIHTPEFSFEKDIKNVTKAAQRFGLTFPIVLDNDYATWNAYRNQYWPHKYIIDIKGNIVYEHIGEGHYAETEAEIVKQLKIRMKTLGETGTVKTATTNVPTYTVQAGSPETYFGSFRNEYFGNGTPRIAGQVNLIIPEDLKPNKFYLGNSWNITSEYIENTAVSSSIAYSFSAANMYLVAESRDGSPISARILLDGKPISADYTKGTDVKDGVISIDSSRLYHIFSSPKAESHRIDIIFMQPGAKAYTFTFG